MPSPVFADSQSEFAAQYAEADAAFGPAVPAASLPSLEDGRWGAFAAKVRFSEVSWLLAANVVAEIVLASAPADVAEALAELGGQ